LDQHENPQAPAGGSPAVSPTIVLTIAILLFVGGMAYQRLSVRSEPIPPAIAADPLLSRGREIYLDRCLSCHGPAGKGDGPLAKGLTGPPPRNLAEEPWKHGEKPEQVLTVLADGVKDAQMPGWAGTYGPEDLKAVAAYVYQIAGKPVPDALRKP
jgi:mono/diheme cytochrome c family protein